MRKREIASNTGRSARRGRRSCLVASKEGKSTRAASAAQMAFTSVGVSAKLVNYTMESFRDRSPTGEANDTSARLFAKPHRLTFSEAAAPLIASFSHIPRVLDKEEADEQMVCTTARRLDCLNDGRGTVRIFWRH